MDNDKKTWFGLNLGGKDKKKDREEKAKKSFVEPTSEDGTITVAGGGHIGHALDIGGDIKNEAELIMKYRDAAQVAEVDAAIDDIIYEAINTEADDDAVKINMDSLELKDNIKEKISEEFDNILSLLHFTERGQDIFRDWYIDGRLAFHKVVNEKREAEGISELRLIDPSKLSKVRKKHTQKESSGNTTVDVVKEIEEFFVYRKSESATSTTGLKIHPDAIAYVTSGLTDPKRTQVYSHIHKALKPINQLSMLETALVIYRLARAPERRAFYVDVGNLPRGKAEEYVNNLMNKYRNKIVYDAQSGDIKDASKHMSIMDDFWLPRREGSKGTEIDVLAGGSNLSDIEDILYFRKKVLKALKVPMSRQETESQFSFGRTGEITRDEVKFQKFVSGLRRRFSMLFYDLLKTQLILKKIFSEEDWAEHKNDIRFDFQQDNNYAELKEVEVLRERINILSELDEYVGRYYSSAWVRKVILKQTEEDIKEMDKEIKRDGDDKELDEFDESTFNGDDDVIVDDTDINQESSLELQSALLAHLRK